MKCGVYEFVKHFFARVFIFGLVFNLPAQRITDSQAVCCKDIRVFKGYIINIDTGLRNINSSFS